MPRVLGEWPFWGGSPRGVAFLFMGEVLLHHQCNYFNACAESWLGLWPLLDREDGWFSAETATSRTEDPPLHLGPYSRYITRAHVVVPGGGGVLSGRYSFTCNRWRVLVKQGLRAYRGTSLIKKRTPLGPYCRLTCLPRVLGGS